MRFRVAALMAGMALFGVLLFAGSGCAKKAVARVNGVTITEEQFQDALVQNSSYAMGVLDRLITRTLVEQEAKKKGITVTPQEVDAAYNSMVQSQGEDFQRVMQMQGVGVADFKQGIQLNLTVAKLKLTDKEIKDFFEKNHARFDTPVRAKYRRIVMTNKDGLAKVRAQLAKNASLFPAIAKAESVDPTSKNQGGEMPTAENRPGIPDQIKETYQKVFSLPVGEISEAFPSPYPANSFQIIQVTERTQGKPAALDSARYEVMLALLGQRSAEISKWVTDLKANASLEIFQAKFRPLEKQYRDLRQERPPSAGPGPAPAPSETKPSEKPPAGQPKSGGPAGK